MAITYTGLIDDQLYVNGTGPATTGSFTPTANRQLLAIVSAEENSGTTDPSGFFTVADSQTLTWTRVGFIGNTTTWSQGIAAWVSSPAAATSTTVTFTCSGRPMDTYLFGVLEFGGATGATAGFVATAATTTDGAYSKTLAVAPTDADMSVFARMLDSGTTTLSMGAGWTVVVDQADSSGNGALAVAVRLNDTSTTVSVADTNVSGTGASKATDVAFILTAALPRRMAVRPSFTAISQAGPR